MRHSAVMFGLSGAAIASWSGVAGAHSIPRLYAALTPEQAYDPWNGCALTGGGLVLGLGVDPERDALIVRGDFFAPFVRRQGTSVGYGSAILYRWVLRTNRDVVWTWALGGGGLLAIDDADVVWSTVGVRGEVSARFGQNVAITAFALTGPSAGRDVRVPWGAPVGLMIEVGAP